MAYRLRAIVLALLAISSCSPEAVTHYKSEAALETALGDPATRANAARYIEDHPDAVGPFQLAKVSATLFAAGQRLRGAYWYYIFQIRSRPWAESDRRGDSYAALRSSMMADLGPSINGWVNSDCRSMRTVAMRAIADEARMPLYRNRPDGIGEAQWRASVDHARKAYAQEAGAAFAEMSPADCAAQRRANGLRVGPLVSPGAPLP